jgi:peptidoglycan/xylan/chitin deacetylase (PgdA/CDA1 family)
MVFQYHAATLRMTEKPIQRPTHKRLAMILLSIMSGCVLFLCNPASAGAQSFQPIGIEPSTAKASPTSGANTRADDLLRYAPKPFEIRQPPALPAVPARFFHHGPRNEPRLALTFDACATQSKSGYDERLIQVLVERHVPATLFLGGKWMAEHPEATRYLGSCGQFELANHSFLHPHMVGLSAERLRQELWRPQVILYSLTGRQANLFRAPYVEIDDNVVRAAARMGLTTVQCDLVAGDPDPAVTADRMVRSVSQRARNGSIILMHMNGRGWHTAAALPGVIDELTRRGFALTTVSELIRSPR